MGGGAVAKNDPRGLNSSRKLPGMLADAKVLFSSVVIAVLHGKKVSHGH
jgi:hypothetical protein